MTQLSGNKLRLVITTKGLDLLCSVSDLGLRVQKTILSKHLESLMNRKESLLYKPLRKAGHECRIEEEKKLLMMIRASHRFAIQRGGA